MLESIAKCAQCVVCDDSDAAGVEFKCLNCQKHVSDFNPVTIRSWKKKQKREKSDWRCFDCLHPACGKCEIASVYVAVHNAWVNEKENYKHAKTDETRAKVKGQLKAHAASIFGRGESVWFCTKCKYPTCSGCQKDRFEKRANRFLPWSCAACEEWDEQFKNLQTVIDSCHGQLPSQAAEGEDQRTNGRLLGS